MAIPASDEPCTVVENGTGKVELLVRKTTVFHRHPGTHGEVGEPVNDDLTKTAKLILGCRCTVEMTTMAEETLHTPCVRWWFDLMPMFKISREEDHWQDIFCRDCRTHKQHAIKHCGAVSANGMYWNVGFLKPLQSERVKKHDKENLEKMRMLSTARFKIRTYNPLTTIHNQLHSSNWVFSTHAQNNDQNG